MVAENQLNEQQTKAYVGAMETMRFSEMLAYLMAVGLQATYRGPNEVLQKLVLNKASTHLLRFLIFARNQQDWVRTVIDAFDPVGLHQFRSQLESNIEAILTWIYSTWVNVSGIMHPLDETPATTRGENEWPGFLLPSQVASLMLVETEVLIPLIAPIAWPIFGSMMALRYPTQPLKIAATASVHSILHFVNFEENQQIPSFSKVVRTFGNLRPPTAYTMIKDRQQVEYNYTATIRARARCAFPLAQEFHPVEWLHMPISPKTGSVASVADWNEKELLKTLKTVIEKLGGRDHGQEPSGLRHAFVCD